MSYKDIPDNEKSPNPFFAIVDIAERNETNQDSFNDDKKLLAEQVRQLASSAYTRSRTFLNYRKKFIAVKVENVQQADRIQNSDQIASLLMFCKDHNLKTKNLRSHFIVEIK